MRCAAFPAFIERQSKGIVACMWEQPVTACMYCCQGCRIGAAPYAWHDSPVKPAQCMH